MFILSVIVSNLYSYEIRLKLIIKVNNNLDHNSFPKEIEENIINLRDVEINAAKKIPARIESMVVNSKDLLSEPLDLYSD